MKPRNKEQQFYWRTIHLEYRVNADSDVILNYLMQQYISISHYLKVEDIDYVVDLIQIFTPEQEDVFQYGLIAKGHSENNIHKIKSPDGTFSSVDPLWEKYQKCFLLLLCKGKKILLLLILTQIFETYMDIRLD